MSKSKTRRGDLSPASLQSTPVSALASESSGLLGVHASGLLSDEERDEQVLSSGAADAECRAFRCGAAEVGQRLDRILAMHVDEFSRSYLQTLVERGLVRVNGVVQATASRKPAPGALIEVRLELPEESRAFVPEPIELEVLHEDEHLLVVNKPVGMVVHPAPGHWRGTLLNALLAHHAAASTLPRAGIVHRLDKETSGVLLLTKTAEADRAVDEAIGLLAREHAQGGTGSSLVLRGLSWALLGMVARFGLAMAATASNLHGSHLLTRFDALLEQHFRAHWRVADYARELAVTPTHLSRVTRSVAGGSASRLIDARVVREARRHLAFTNLSITSVAYTLGFADPALFSRVFARVAGCSPRQFRRQLEARSMMHLLKSSSCIVSTSISTCVTLPILPMVKRSVILPDRLALRFRAAS